MLISNERSMSLKKAGGHDEFYRVIILGAGCSGLSLAWYLVQNGFKEEILLIDQRSDFINDRTWCYWDVESTPFDDLATHAWSSMRLTDVDCVDTDIATDPYRYLHLKSEDFYQRILDRLRQAGNVNIKLGQRIEGWEESSRYVTVFSNGTEYRGERVFDSIRGAQTMSADVTNHCQLRQQFFGQTLRTESPLFDAERIILMDYRVPQDNGTHFVYLLPFSENEALVENTYFTQGNVSLDRLRSELEDYLETYWGLSKGNYEIVREEKGRILMSDQRIVRDPASRVQPIGLVGDAARASSGYAFLRIQRQCRKLAEEIASGSSNIQPHPPAGLKYHLFDAIFLRALTGDPGRSSEFFTGLFQRARTESVIRFLTEKSNWMDDLRIILSLFRPPLIAAALRYLGESIMTLVDDWIGRRSIPSTTPEEKTDKTLSKRRGGIAPA